MCSAIQPWRLAIAEAMPHQSTFAKRRVAIADPNDQMRSSSGKWLMYFFSIGAQGQGSSCCPSSRGAPTECRQGTNVPSSPSFSTTLVPTRVMMCMLHTT